ncbi:MAG: hypothetical protein IT256_01050 [Chitinophagaceae bacterium]|nr:hypothetical protein [Chitinophagaceae bacterium]
MKLFNTLFLSAATIVVLAASSCTKEYTCQCTIKYTGVAGLPDSSINEYQVRDTKSKAKSMCEGSSATFEKDNVTTTETCLLF